MSDIPFDTELNELSHDAIIFLLINYWHERFVEILWKEESFVCRKILSLDFFNSISRLKTAVIYAGL
jgi:hypothetical protein